MARRRGASTARWFLAVHTVLLLIGVVVVFVLLAYDAKQSARDRAQEMSINLATTIAAEPGVVSVVESAHEGAAADRDGTVAEASAVLQPMVADILDATGIDYITIMDTDRTRYTHRNPSEIGGAFVGTIDPSLAGEVFSEVYTGTLGPSVRAVAPVFDDGGEVVGLVSAGVTLTSVDSIAAPRLIALGIGSLIAFAVAVLGAALLSRRLDRVTAGLGADELATLFAAHRAVLHSVEEGLVVLDGETVLLANDEAMRLLGADGLEVPFTVDDPAVSAALRSVLRGEEPDDLVTIGDRALVLDRTATSLGKRSATIISVRDRTELQRVTGELSSVRTISNALRAQTHEFANRLHTIATLIEVGKSEEALGFAVSERDLGQRLTDRVVHAIEEPVIAALLLGKAAQARERSVEMYFETHLSPGTHWLQPAEVVTILGNLVDNAIDAAADAATGEQPSSADERAWVEVYLASADDGALIFQVSDSGPGVPEEDRERIFRSGYSTKDADASGRGYGLALVRRVAESLGGTVEVGEGELRAQGAHAGAVFTVTLPPPAARAGAALSSAERGGT